MLGLLTSAFWLTCVLGSGSVKSWRFKEAAYAYPPSAMTFLEGIKEAVIFGKISNSALGGYYTYVTTMTDSNKLSDYTTLEGVLEITSVVAHSTDDNIVLVAGVAETGEFTTYGVAFVGALYVAGGNSFEWEMFSLVGGSNSSYDEHMSCIEVFPDSNMFVAAGNSDGAGEGNGMIFAAYDLDDFSQLYAMQHTAYYYSTNSVGEALVRGMARIGSNDFVVANTGHNSYSSGNGLCRFSVSRDSMQVQWCRQFISDSYKEYSIAGVHVNGDFTTILVTGYKYFGGYYYPFVRHFDMQGRYQQCYFWAYDLFDYGYIYTSFYDTVNDMLYLGGSYSRNHPSSLVLVYSVGGQYLDDVRAWKGATKDKRIYFRPESVRGIVKSDNGTLMFANEPHYTHYPKKSALVTITHMDCFDSHVSKYTEYTDDSGNSTKAQTVYFGNYFYEEVSEYSYGMSEHLTKRTKTLCGKSGNGPFPWAIIGGAIGGFCGFVLLCTCILWLKNNYTGKSKKTSSSPPTTFTRTTTSKGPVEASTSVAAAAPPMYASAPPAYGGGMCDEGVTTGEQTEGYAVTREEGNRY